MFIRTKVRPILLTFSNNGCFYNVAPMSQAVIRSAVLMLSLQILTFQHDNLLLTKKITNILKGLAVWLYVS